MSRPTLYFLHQIDCEATQPATQDAELGRRSLCGYAEVLEKNNLKGTFYCIPGEARANRDIYVDLRKRGHEVGLHVHAADLGYDEFLGAYGPDEQREIISSSTNILEEELGFRPNSVGLGYGSSNDHTRLALVELGYSHGMTQMPGRILPECASVAAGAPEDPYYPHRWNRVLKGDLDFVEIPNTYDQESRMWGGKHPQDLRVELVDAKNHYYTILKNVQRLLREKPEIFTVSVLTHNIFEYSDPRDFRRETVEGIIAHVSTIAEQFGMNVVGATHADVAAAFRKKVPLIKGGPRLNLDRRGWGHAARPTHTDDKV